MLCYEKELVEYAAEQAYPILPCNLCGSQTGMKRQAVKALIDGLERVAHITLLFLGSVLLCYPSLQVFGSYLGVRMHPAQTLAIALVIPSAAALFTFGFAPIYWFLNFTMPGDGPDGMPSSSAITRVVLLVFSLLLALSHLNRCLFGDSNLKVLRDNWALWVGWQVLLVFLTYRMAESLDLLT
ncbi:MAG TPA: hypothetical protein EYP98_04500 [Planctomycetes bacterium]|nr:hypothetical protein [Planctomycetota bacterium]